VATIEQIKELALAQKPLVLFTFTFSDGSISRFATHAVTFGGQSYSARVLRHNFFEVQSMSEQGTDQVPRISLTLANADTQMSQLNASKSFKGAALAAVFVIAAGVAGESDSTDSWTIFQGVCDAPAAITDLEVEITASNRMNLQRVVLPPARIQRRCPWVFPATVAERQAGADDRNSIFHPCGYSPDATGGNERGNYVSGTTPYTACDFSRAACVARGMFSTDSLARVTRRFGGVEYAPPVYRVRPYGAKWQDSAVQEAQYGDPIPLVYGTAWVETPITVGSSEGNLTRLECVISYGEINAVRRVIVNGVEIPQGISGRDMTTTGWWNLVNAGDRIGDFDLNFTDAAGNPVGDPYGSIAYLSVVVPNKLTDGKPTAEIRVLVDGRLVETYTSGGASEGWSWSQNPAWVLLDLLKMARWPISLINTASFRAVADYCATNINQKDSNGNTMSAARFRCNMAVRQYRSAADLVLGVRNNARLYFTYGSDGKLALNVERTIAGQQPSKPYGSNASGTINGGWPAYVYSDATATILRKPDGSASLSAYSRPIADTPTRLSFEFQDADRDYVQDNFTYVDIGEQLATGADISAGPPVDGIPGIDQAQRIGAWLGTKSVDANVYVDFETSVKALGQQVGQIIALTYAKESWTNKLFRILRVAPQQNYRVVRITAQQHDDAWYADTWGQEGPPLRRPLFGSERTLPRPVKGTVPFADLRFDADGQDHLVGFGTEEAEGSGISLLVTAFGPSQQLSKSTSTPQVDIQATVATTGGNIPGGQTLYYAIAAADADGYVSEPSATIVAVIPAGTNTNKVTLTGISYDASAAGLRIFRGRTPLTMNQIDNPVPVSSRDDLGAQNVGVLPADPLFDHANYYWRRVTALALTARDVDIFSASTVGDSTLAMTVNAHAGRTVEIVRGDGRGQVRTIASNTATTLTVSSNWVTNPSATSVFIIRPQATSATATTITDSGLSLPSLANSLVRIVSGKGAGQERRIASNTATTITVEEAWEVTPDTTSGFIVVENSWTYNGAAATVSNDVSSSYMQGRVVLPNEPLLTVEVAVVAATAQDFEAGFALSPISRYAIEGLPYAPIAPPLIVGGQASHQISGGPELIALEDAAANHTAIATWVSTESGLRHARLLIDIQGNHEWSGPDPDVDQNILMGWSAIGRLSLQGIGGGGLNIVAWKHTYLNGAITAAATTCTVTDGAALGWTSGSIRCRIENEIVYVTNVTGNTVTMSRGQEGTTAATHATGLVFCRLGTPEDQPRLSLNNDGAGILFTSGAAVSDCRIFRGAEGIFAAEVKAGVGGGLGILEVGDSFHKIFLSGDSSVGIKFGSGAAAGDVQLYRPGALRLVVKPVSTDGTQIFQVLNAAGTPKFGVDTSNGRAGVGTLAGAPAYTLDVGGDLHVTGAVVLDTVLPIAQGGTAAATAATARSNLGAAASAGITGAVRTLAKLTPGGTNGSITYNSEGIITASVEPT